MMMIADTSIRDVLQSAALENRPLRFVDARTVEARSRFSQHREEHQGIFFDSVAIAGRGARTVLELVIGAPGLLSFRVPPDLSGPTNGSDVVLASGWRPRAELPMMSMPVSEAGGSRL